MVTDINNQIKPLCIQDSKSGTSQPMYKIYKAGSCLLSHLAALSSARGSLTSVFGMGTGISSPSWPPAFFRLSLRHDSTQGRETKTDSKGNDNMAKPHGLLVMLGCVRRRTCTCILSTRCSPGGLQGTQGSWDVSSCGGLPA